MKTGHVVRWLGRTLARACTGAALLVLWTSSPLAAQTSTGTIRGFVRSPDGGPVAQANIVARDVELGTERRTQAGDNGFFNLPGLRPARYELTVRRIGFGAQLDTVQVLIGQTLARDFSLTQAANELEAVVVQAGPTAVETRTSETATNITQEQIENLPQSDRNFLNFAQQAPGVRLDRGGNFAAGAQIADNVNLFIDGASYKSEILPGGIAGQDPGNRNSAFNPFPQSAVQEFRVITQNFKAEYQKASSALITATTKSGSNRWEGNAFAYTQPARFTERNFFESQDNRRPPELKRLQLGLSGGGPIIRDRMHFFGAIETNDQDNDRVVRLNRRDGAPQFLLDREGTFSSPLEARLLFGKLTYQTSPEHSFELSATARDEFELRDFGGTGSREGATRLNNDVTTGVFKYQYAGARFLNEAQAYYQRYRYNPQADGGSGIVQEFVDFLTIGPKDSEQDLRQTRLAFRDDITATVNALGGTHVFKVGGNLDFVEYDVNKTLFGNPKFFYFGNFTTPAFALIGIGDPSLNERNRQLGAYIQDDWSIGPRLELNLGLRWDYESNGFNNQFRTPDSVRTIVGSRVSDNFFSNGNNREPFKGAFQPRLGFSYDVFGSGRTTLFGGAGIYYDRNAFNNVLDEQYRLQYVQYVFEFQERPGDGRIPFQPSYLSAEGLRGLLASGRAGAPEIFLNANDTKLPRSLQTSFGVRQRMGAVLLSASYGGVRGYNQFSYIPLRDQATGNIIGGPGFNKILLSSDDSKSFYNALYLKLDKPYTREAQWGLQVAYTLSEAETEGTDEGQGNFNFDVLSERAFRRHPTQGDERHRITANWVREMRYGFLFSGLLTLGSGTPFNVITGCPRTKTEVDAARETNPTFEQFCVDKGYYGNGNFTAEDDFAPGTSRNSGRPPKQSFIFGRYAYRNVDFRLNKNFDIAGQRLGLVGEVFNAFGFDNLRYNTRNLRFDQQRPPVDFGSGDRTRYQLGATVKF